MLPSTVKNPSGPCCTLVIVKTRVSDSSASVALSETTDAPTSALSDKSLVYSASVNLGALSLTSVISMSTKVRFER